MVFRLAIAVSALAQGTRSIRHHEVATTLKEESYMNGFVGQGNDAGGGGGYGGAQGYGGSSIGGAGVGSYSYGQGNVGSTSSTYAQPYTGFGYGRLGGGGATRKNPNDLAVNTRLKPANISTHDSGTKHDFTYDGKDKETGEKYTAQVTIGDVDKINKAVQEVWQDQKDFPEMNKQTHEHRDHLKDLQEQMKALKLPTDD